MPGSVACHTELRQVALPAARGSVVLDELHGVFYPWATQLFGELLVKLLVMAAHTKIVLLPFRARPLVATLAYPDPLIQRYLEVNATPLGNFRLVLPELAPLGDVVRERYTFMAFGGTPLLLIVASKASEIRFDRLGTVAAVDPCVVVIMGLVALAAELQLLAAMANETVRILSLKLSHQRDRSALCFAAKPPVHLDPVGLLVVFAEGLELLPVAFHTNSSVDKHSARHGSWAEGNLLMAG